MNGIINTTSAEMIKIHHALYGFIVGDALGVPVEFMSRQLLDDNPVTNMREFGTYHQPKGTWSDDTTMTLCVYKNIAEGEDYKSLMNDFTQWYSHGYMTPFGQCFDIGVTTQQALNAYMQGVPPLEAGGNKEWDNGNGALMRVLPLLCFSHLSFAERVQKVQNYSALTHRHQRSHIACVFYLEMTRKLLHGQDKFEAYQQTIDQIKEYYQGDKELAVYHRILSGDIHTLPRDKIQSSGYVVSTLEAVLWCFLNHDNYKETVLKAVNLGGDTDTIAAITGGLAGLLYGKENIPTEWLDALQNQALIEKVLKG